MASKLFVGGLSWGTTEDSLRNHFSQVGTVVSATVITDKYTGKSKGFGFVELSTEEEAQQAKDQLNGKELDGREITVSDARPQQPRENRFGGGGGRGGNRGGDRFQRNDGGYQSDMGGDTNNDMGGGDQNTGGFGE